VRLSIRIAGGASQFHVGEVIPIELAFSASGNDTYQMSTRTFDRSGRLDTERFHVSPPGRDPLLNYYQGDYGSWHAFMGGGPDGFHNLSGEPRLIVEDLNEWVALGKPGRYSLYVTSDRVSRLAESKAEAVELRSNTIEFDVVEADAAWQDQVLRSAVSTIGDASSSPEQKQAAIRRLRFLDSPASASELIRLLTAPGDGSRWDFFAGLMGSRHQDWVSSQLERELEAPDVAITERFLTLLAITKSVASHGPAPSSPERDKQQLDAWNARMAERATQFARLERELDAKASALVSSKRGAARAETARMLLSRPGAKPLAGMSPETAASAFLALTPQQQSELLSNYWGSLKSPVMAGAFEQLLERPKIPIPLRELALKRLFEIDPTKGTARIMAEIRQPHLDHDYDAVYVSAKVLGALPNKALPEFDELLARRLEANGDPALGSTAQLIARYSTNSILDRVKARYETAAGKWECKTEDGFVSYFLRVDPDYGIVRLRANGGHCLKESLAEVVRMRRWAEVEPAVIALLNDPDEWTAREAASTLAAYGGPKTEEALWRLLKSLHQQWADREQLLRVTVDTPRDAPAARAAAQFELVVRALGTAQGWLLDNDQITALGNLTLGRVKEYAAHWRWQSPVKLELRLGDDGQFEASVNGFQYRMNDLESLQAKLAQYPRGTHFQMRAFGAENQLAPLVRAVRETAQQFGLVIDGAGR
jgi:hypothetical protein